MSNNGSIPAWAGEPGAVFTRRREYPEWAGEPPRTWSIPAWAGEPSQRRCCYGAHGRSIPAWAGEPSPSYGSNWRSLGSIPAWAGEPMLRLTLGVPRIGLSPRGRGNVLLDQIINRRWSIPAWAGEPRGNGAYIPQVRRGLSPRGRGNRSECMVADMPVYPRVGGGTLIL